ncbi:MAG: DUF433 domain-containing protein [Chloroflexi bacterium]|nr:DUF433 domain-containing protein [Chloroflexota bacterium]
MSTHSVEARELGRFIVADPAICHGQLTFRGTRILVKHVLEQVAMGMSWDAVADKWRGAITKEAIAEAVRLASDALVARQHDLLVEPARA